MKQTPKNRNIDITSTDKVENLDEFTNNKNTSPFDDIEILKRDNDNLKFLLSKYNIILSEYQLKFGNEVFSHLDELIMKEKNESNLDTINSSQLRKFLIENISLIRELEKNNLEQSQRNDYINNELLRYQKDLEDLVKENNELRDDLENLKE